MVIAVHYGAFEEALGLVILNNALAPLVHYSESHTLVPRQILHNAQLTILYRHSNTTV